MMKQLVRTAQLLFFVGLAVSLWDLSHATWMVGSVNSLHWLNPHLTIPLLAALVLWFVGDALLYIEAQDQYRQDNEKIAYVLQQINCLAAGVLALAPIPHWTDIGSRCVCVLALAYVLYQQKCMQPATIFRCLVPLVWWKKIWSGSFGPTAGWLVGTELMAWGISMFGVCIPLGWALLALANLWLARWNWLDMKQGADVKVWFRINLAFMTVAAMQTAWALWLLWG